MFNAQTVYLSFVIVAVTLAAVLMIMRAIRAARKETLDEIRNLLPKGHGPKGEPCPAGAPAVVSPSPAPVEVGAPSPVLARSAVEVAPPASEVPSTKPARSRQRPQPLRAIHDDPTLASAEDAPTSADVRAAFHREADERDARHAARPAVPPPAPVGASSASGAPSGDAAVAARFQGAPRPADEHGEMTLQRAPALPSADVDEGDRSTDEEGTRVYSRDPSAADAQIPGVPVKQKPPAPPTSTARPPPHAPPRRTLLGGLAGASMERPKSSATRAAADFAARTAPREPSWVDKRAAQLVAGGAGAEARERAAREGSAANASPGAAGDRDTLTPTDPSARPLDARVSRRWAELVAAAHLAGDDAAHCHGAMCKMQGEGIALCECQCDACGLLLELLVQAERDVRRETGQE